MIVAVIVAVDVIATVIVAVHVHGNGTVDVIDVVDGAPKGENVVGRSPIIGTA